jgi:hypothetical protein
MEQVCGRLAGKWRSCLEIFPGVNLLHGQIGLASNASGLSAG